tara:strand:+ start:8 stop:463 length:456 start_codon:yes stop_codon:yes gene_type:complete
VTDNYLIVPYRKEHGDQIINEGLNYELLKIDASYEELRIDHSRPGMSFTLLGDGTPIVCGGIIPLWNGVCEGWIIGGKRIFQAKIKAARLIKKRTDLLCLNNNVSRLQTAVKAGFKEGYRFAKFLGLQDEGLMKKYGPDGSDYYRMAKIYL